MLMLPTRRHLGEAKNAYDNRHALHTFSVGIAGSPDLLAARKVGTWTPSHTAVQSGCQTCVTEASRGRARSQPLCGQAPHMAAIWLRFS